MKLHAMYGADGEFYPAEVASLSTSAKKKKTPVKVHYIGYETTDDAWVSLDMLKCKALPKDKKTAPAPPKATKGTKAVAAPKAKAKAKREMDYSGLTKGMRLQAEADGKYWAAEVVVVSRKKDTPVKVTFIGYDTQYDEWLGSDRLRSKAIVPKSKGSQAAFGAVMPQAAKKLLLVKPKGSTAEAKPSVKAPTCSIRSIQEEPVLDPVGRSPSTAVRTPAPYNASRLLGSRSEEWDKLPRRRDTLTPPMSRSQSFFKPGHEEGSTAEAKPSVKVGSLPQLDAQPMLLGTAFAVTKSTGERAPACSIQEEEEEPVLDPVGRSPSTAVPTPDAEYFGSPNDDRGFGPSFFHAAEQGRMTKGSDIQEGEEEELARAKHTSIVTDYEEDDMPGSMRPEMPGSQCVEANARGISLEELFIELRWQINTFLSTLRAVLQVNEDGNKTSPAPIIEESKEKPQEMPPKQGHAGTKRPLAQQAAEDPWASDSSGSIVVKAYFVDYQDSHAAPSGMSPAGSEPLSLSPPWQAKKNSQDANQAPQLPHLLCRPGRMAELASEEAKPDSPERCRKQESHSGSEAVVCGSDRKVSEPGRSDSSVDMAEAPEALQDRINQQLDKELSSHSPSEAGDAEALKAAPEKQVDDLPFALALGQKAEDIPSDAAVAGFLLQMHEQTGKGQSRSSSEANDLSAYAAQAEQGLEDGKPEEVHEQIERETSRSSSEAVVCGSDRKVSEPGRSDSSVDMDAEYFGSPNDDLCFGPSIFYVSSPAEPEGKGKRLWKGTPRGRQAELTEVLWALRAMQAWLK